MLKIVQLAQNLWIMNIEKDILCPESLVNHVCQLLSPCFHFSMTVRQKYAAAMTGTIQGPIYLHLARKNDFPDATLVYEDE